MEVESKDVGSVEMASLASGKETRNRGQKAYIVPRNSSRHLWEVSLLPNGTIRPLQLTVSKDGEPYVPMVLTTSAKICSVFINPWRE